MVAERTVDQLPYFIRDVDGAIEALRNDELIALDLETGGLSPWRDPVAVVSLYGEQSGATAILHIRGTMPPRLRAFLEQPYRTFVTHNGACFDMLFLAENGVNVLSGATWLDTLVAEQAVLQTGRRDVRKNLQATLARRLKVDIKKGMGTSPWMSPQLSDEQLIYCAEDIMYMPRLWREQNEKVAGTRQADAIDYEMRLIPIVVRMTLNGLPLSRPALHAYRDELAAKQARADALLKTKYDGVNVRSVKQIKALWLARFGTELDDTQAATLSIIKENAEGDVAELAGAILTVREARTRSAMYSDDWVRQYVERDGRVHARFNQLGTDTGRFSASSPNLQQVPKEGRKIFGALEGYSIVSCDFSQIEVFGAAAVHHDDQLLADLLAGDVYRGLASSMFNCAPEDVDPKQRSLAKICLLAFQYAGTPRTMIRAAAKFGKTIPQEDARRYHDAFFRRYARLNVAKQKAQLAVQRRQPATFTMATGLRRVLAGPTVSPAQLLNTAVQGQAAAGMKLALLEAARRGLHRHLGATVHDELVSCVPTGDAEAYGAELSDAMIAGMRKVFDLPIKTEVTVGPCWTK